MPIVFCASLLPWLNAMNAAEPTCSVRNRSFIVRGLARRNRFRRTTMKMNPIVSPRTGERTSGTRTLFTTPSTLIACAPSAIRTAPSSPPISAWLDELGMPRRHVIRFQTIAPTSAAATMIWPGGPSGVVARPDEIVTATAVPVSAPTKFAVADMRIACSGRSARVDTDVAIAFAVSWKPLM